ncbi:unnamed protein product [Ilex paraguariensis]|uniref:Short-chain dehydrogenase/reductase n=1 Tax=Ilex paraguariensis TaxID=185542 RepID=A0ABC8STR7_9AQUA
MKDQTTKRVAIVTGANKGIGLEICRQLASNGITVILTARDKERGVEAVEKLKTFGLSDVFFHQLDVMDLASVASLADFIKTQFGKLDILINNAAITGAIFDEKGLETLKFGFDAVFGAKAKLLKECTKGGYAEAEACLRTNYYGVKQVIKGLLPLLQQSNSARIVNVSSSLGQLQFMSHERAKEELGNIDGLTEEKVDEVVKEFLKDAKEGLLEIKSWPINYSAYMVSKAALNGFTRILAKTYPNIAINAVCPGFVKTELNYNSGILTVEEGAKGPVKLALMPNGGPSGLFFSGTEVSTF